MGAFLSKKEDGIMKIRSCFYIALLFGLLLPVQAYAMLMGTGQFDRLIHNAEIVIKAKVVPQKEGGFGDITFNAKVISILKSDGEPIPENLSLNSAIFIWPTDMGVPFEKKQAVLLVLRRAEGRLNVVNNFRAILPATKSKIDHKSGNSIRRKVFDELHAFLPQAKGEASQALVLVHLSFLASKTDEKIFLPYLKSKDKRLQHAALASLNRISPTAKRIQATAADFENHLSKNPVDYSVYKPRHHPQGIPDDHLFWEIYKDVKWVSRCGAWGMEKNMTERARAYLPIYRMLIDKAPADYQRVHVGIEALKNVGAREDVHRLYKYLNHKNAWIRHNVLEGLGRILKIKIKRPSIPSYEMPQSRSTHIVEWEKQTRATIKKALIEEGFLVKEK